MTESHIYKMRLTILPFKKKPAMINLPHRVLDSSVR